MFSIRNALTRGQRRAWIPALAVVLLPYAAHAQSKPDKTVEMVVPTAAGGGNDKTARVIRRDYDQSKALLTELGMAKQ